MPKWDGKIWAGDQSVEGFTRAQADESFACKDPVVEQYVAITYEDLRELFAIVQSCKEWPKGMAMMPAREALERFKILMTDLEREALEDRLSRKKRK